MSDLRIVIADDHELFRAGLRRTLEARPGWIVAGEARTGREAADLVQRLDADVAVLDINMPEMNGLEATRAITAASPRCQVLILTLHDSEELVRAVLSAGARGYVLKSDAANDVVRGVDAVSHHGSFFTSRIAAMVLDGYVSSGVQGEPEAALPTLTPRERQVAQLVAEGKSNKEVAATLGISVKTAESHRANIMHKLRLDSVSDLVRWAVRNHLTEP